MTDEQYRALVAAVLGYAGLKTAYADGVTVEEGDLLDAALLSCKPADYKGVSR